MLDKNKDITIFTPLIPFIYGLLSKYGHLHRNGYELIVDPEIILCFDSDYNGYIIKQNGEYIKVEKEEKWQNVLDINIYLKNLETEQLDPLLEASSSFSEIFGTCLQRTKKKKLSDFINDFDLNSKKRWDEILSMDLIDVLNAENNV